MGKVPVASGIFENFYFYAISFDLVCSKVDCFIKNGNFLSKKHSRTCTNHILVGIKIPVLALSLAAGQRSASRLLGLSHHEKTHSVALYFAVVGK